MHTLRGHSGPIVNVEFSPDGRRLLTMSTHQHSAAGRFVETKDLSVRVWDTVTGQELVRFLPVTRIHTATWIDNRTICTGIRLWKLPDSLP